MVTVRHSIPCYVPICTYLQLLTLIFHLFAVLTFLILRDKKIEQGSMPLDLKYNSLSYQFLYLAVTHINQTFRIDIIISFADTIKKKNVIKKLQLSYYNLKCLEEMYARYILKKNKMASQCFQWMIIEIQKQNKYRNSST